MTLTIELTPEQEARLQAEAKREGMDTVAYALRRLGLETLQNEPQPGERQEQAWGPIVQAALSDPNAPPRPAPKSLPDFADNRDSMGALFAQWEAEDAALSPEEYAESERQWEAFRERMNVARREVGSEEVICCSVPSSWTPDRLA